jgi:hypothetical protein
MVENRRFGTTYMFHFQGPGFFFFFFLYSLTLNLGHIGISETSVISQLTLRNNPENGRIQLNCSEKSTISQMTEFRPMRLNIKRPLKEAKK